ncbi:SPRY-domain-containing protein [Sporormia fimetaria CBS 119925]|uniref:SPRY-domain-containing protein n=1 Tax=Sporormia fimetaria CBS 119925 TaxID=1340428 RepID=A0A6A6VPJ9_9PLEO|nr:SPRY-domain-containing protein [Sporormia fimetaria CBS 119925]
MFRRSSYAEVAAGNSSQSPNSGPIRSSAFEQLLQRAPPSIGRPTPRQRRGSRSLDFDEQISMSRSWGRPSHFPPQPLEYIHREKTLEDDDADEDFFVPSYLKGSRYASMAEKAVEQRRAAARSRNNLSRTTSSASLRQRNSGVSIDIVERVAPVSNDLQLWPTRWNEMDKNVQIELDEDGSVAKYAGPQKLQEEAAAVRANRPMPRQAGIYYFEVSVQSRLKEGIIGIGFAGPKVVLTRIPGWEPESFGYHSDDGNCFQNTPSGKPYGPKFKQLDIIGCGMNFRTNTAFFTRNGQFLGTAFHNLKPDVPYYPIVGLKKSGESVWVNFGQEPFVFDIDRMVQDEKDAIYAQIARTRSRNMGGTNCEEAVDENLLVQNLVAQYLSHGGYVDTARAFQEEVNEARVRDGEGASEITLSDADTADGMNRQKIRTAILEGDIDAAIQLTNEHYPTVFRENQGIYFKLRCRKFIELIRRYTDMSNNDLAPVLTPSTTKRSSMARTDDNDFEMDLDDDDENPSPAPPPAPPAPTPPLTHWRHSRPAPPSDDEAERMDEDGDSEEARERQALMAEAIQYGQELKQEFAGDSRKEVQKALEDTFQLIAYEDPREGGCAELLGKESRAPLAEEVNAGILVSMGKSATSALLRMVKQSEALVEVLGEEGGDGAFVHVGRDFM